MLDPLKKSQYGTPIFIVPKKEGTVKFMMEYLRINQQLVINQYPLLRIYNTM